MASGHNDGGTAAIRAPTRVVMLDPIDDDALAVLQRKYQVINAVDATTAEIDGLAEEADVFVVRSGARIDKGLIKSARRLRVIARAGEGVDNIDLHAAEQAGVTVFNVPGGSAPAVAEFALALMLAVVRHVPRADAQIRSGTFEKSTLTGVELRGRTLGMVGLGAIGSRVASLGMAFGMKVMATAKQIQSRRRQMLREQGIELTELLPLLAKADVVCLAVPLTPATRGVIDSAAFSCMKKSSYLINISRSAVVDEAALFHALEHGMIGGAGLDVATDEAAARFSQLKNVVLTPHIGGMTREAQAHIGRVVVQTLAAVLAGEQVPNQCQADRRTKLKQYVFEHDSPLL